jgi:hypothetical protein
MNQMTKTLCFVAAAAGAVVLAYAGRPSALEQESAATASSVQLTPDFKDPLAAKSLKIVRFDEGLSSLSQIEVKEVGGIWTLPSHEDYPADAENRIRDATTPFVGFESVSVVSDNEGDHSLYGVLEPGAGKTAVGDQGVGTLVSVEGEGGKKLVNLIIGKAVKDTPELRYVRQPGRSRVYVAKVDPENLPVRFEDWIEKDLLELQSWDINQLVLKDYSFQVAATLSGPTTDYDQRLEMTVTDDNGKWKLDELLVAQNDQLQPTELKEDEELNTERLNALKDALDGLEIVNVERKPAQLGADLRADEGFANDQAGLQSLLERGFYPVRMPDERVEVLSADGEVLVRTKDGVEYVLRFGGVQGVDTESDEGKLNRYLLVTARVNDAHFPEPDLLPLPETIEDLQKAEQAKAEAESAATNDDSDRAAAAAAETDTEEATDTETGNDSSASNATEETDSAAETDTEVPAAPAENDQSSAVRSPTDTAATQTVLVAQQDNQAADTADTSQATTPTETEANAGENDAADTKVQENVAGQADVASPSDGEEKGQSEDLETKLKQERERITKENQRKIDERNDKLEKAREKVSKLNYRFADWYYVISEDVYKKIHLSHTDIIQEKSADKEADADTGSPNFDLQGLEP